MSNSSHQYTEESLSCEVLRIAERSRQLEADHQRLLRENESLRLLAAHWKELFEETLVTV